MILTSPTGFTYEIRTNKPADCVVNPADFALALFLCFEMYSWENNNKIQVIKIVRTIRGIGLADAKNAVDAAILFLENKKNPNFKPNMNYSYDRYLNGTAVEVATIWQQYGNPSRG